MKTLTMKDHANGIASLTDFKPSIPTFMEAAGTCAVLVRDHRQLWWHERWVATSGFVTDAEGAELLEIESYQSTHDVDNLPIIDDLPEPIACHDADLWDDCVEPDLNDYEYLTHQYETARLVA